jgi:hypothetical protein
MTITARDIIQDAVERIGVYAPGETMSAADSARGLTVLNELLNQWAEEYLSVYQLVPTTITLSNGKGAYTIGVSGAPDISQTRPERIEIGPGAASATFSAVTTLVNVVSAVEWNAIEGIASGTGVPDTLFYSPGYPLGVLNVAPVPTGAGTMSFSAWLALRSFTSLFLPSVILSAGCEDALKTNLALVLKPFFLSAAVDPMLAQQAVKTKAMLGYTNLASRAMIGRGMRAAGPAAA